MKTSYISIIFSLLTALMMNGIATADEGRPLVYVSAFAPGEKGAIHTFRLDPSLGKLEAVQKTTDMEHPFYLAIADDARTLYAIHAPGKFGGDDHEQVGAYTIHPDSGKLTLLNRQSTRGTASCYLDVDATGRTVVVANYSTGSVAALPVGEDGSLGEADSFVQHHGSSVNEARQMGPHAHCIVVSPDNKFAYAADLGLDKILRYRLEGPGKLVTHTGSFVRTIPGAGPRHLTFHPNGKHMYVINELANSVSHFTYEPASGTLDEQQTVSTLPEDFSGTSHCADLRITPDGRYLYATNRGHDSIAAYRIQEDGRLRLIAIDASHGKGPQNLAITANGKYVLCANMPGDNLVAFRVDSDMGTLTRVGDPISIPRPSCIVILESLHEN